MSNRGAAVWYHSNRYTAESECEHCNGVVRHEPWCISLDALVSYAYEIVKDPSKLKLEDELILHALGVSWGQTQCSGDCKK